MTPKVKFNLGLKKTINDYKKINECKVSVIVNFHNSEKYIEECLNSIINQTYENLEIVLWDNCSTDKTYKVIKKFKDQRIKYFYNEKRITL